jgi:hypothetical protein
MGPPGENVKIPLKTLILCGNVFFWPFRGMGGEGKPGTTKVLLVLGMYLKAYISPRAVWGRESPTLLPVCCINSQGCMHTLQYPLLSSFREIAQKSKEFTMY